MALIFITVGLLFIIGGTLAKKSLPNTSSRYNLGRGEYPAQSHIFTGTRQSITNKSDDDDDPLGIL
jgi:hypothetical protein